MVAALWLAGVLSAAGIVNSWKGGTRDWDRPASWSLNKRPAPNHEILITNQRTFTGTVDDKTLASSLTISNLWMSNSAGRTTLLITNRLGSGRAVALTVRDFAAIGQGARLLLTDESAGSYGVRLQATDLLLDSEAVLGRNAALAIGRDLVVGWADGAAGRLVSSNGGVSARAVILGEGRDASGEWIVVDGVHLIGERLQIGSAVGTGRVEHLDGRIVVGGSNANYACSLGASENSTGTIEVVNGELGLASATLAVGERGAGNLTLRGGRVRAKDCLVGAADGGRGRMELAGGRMELGGWLSVGHVGGANGELWLGGGTLAVPDGFLNIGDRGGIGSLVVSNGELTAYEMRVGHQSAASTLTVAGGDCHIGSLWVGYANATGTVWQSGGTITLAGGFYDGRLFLGKGSVSRLICSGGVLRARHVDVFGQGVEQVWEIAGGTNRIAESISIAGGGCTLQDGLLESRTLQLLADYRTNVVMRVLGGELRAAGLLLGNQPPYGQRCTMLVGGGKVTVGYSDYGGEALIADRGAAELVITAGVFRALQLVVGEAGQGQLLVGPEAQLELESLVVARQEQSIGTAEFEGGTWFGPWARRFRSVTIAAGADTRGVLTLRDGGLEVGEAQIGVAGHGWLVMTNSALRYSRLVIGEAGTLDAIGSQLLDPGLGSAVLVNSNFCRIAQVASDWGAAVYNYGTFHVDGGTLSFHGPVHNDGVIVATNSVVNFLGGLTGEGIVLTAP